jgi:outer membrane lipoprotein SlyB
MMNLKTLIAATTLALIPLSSLAGDTVDAAIGGGVGGAIGAAVGNEVGGRDGAIVGGAIGAATGAAITTDDDHDDHGDHRQTEDTRYIHVESQSQGRGNFCPPGQAKKGNC